MFWSAPIILGASNGSRATLSKLSSYALLLRPEGGGERVAFQDCFGDGKTSCSGLQIADPLRAHCNPATDWNNLIASMIWRLLKGEACRVARLSGGDTPHDFLRILASNFHFGFPFRISIDLEVTKNHVMVVLVPRLSG